MFVVNQAWMCKNDHPNTHSSAHSFHVILTIYARLFCVHVCCKPSPTYNQARLTTHIILLLFSHVKPIWQAFPCPCLSWIKPGWAKYDHPNIFLFHSKHIWQAFRVHACREPSLGGQNMTILTSFYFILNIYDRLFRVHVCREPSLGGQHVQPCVCGHRICLCQWLGKCWIWNHHAHHACNPQGMSMSAIVWTEWDEAVLVVKKGTQTLSLHFCQWLGQCWVWDHHMRISHACNPQGKSMSAVVWTEWEEAVLVVKKGTQTLHLHFCQWPGQCWVWDHHTRINLP